MKRTQKGNVIIIVVCLVVALMIGLSYLLKSTTTRIYSTKKLGNTLLARELANTLASLSIKYLKQQLKETDSKIAKNLSLPLDKITTSVGDDLIPIIKDFKNIKDNINILDLITSKSGLKDLKIEKLYWKRFKQQIYFVRF